MCKSDNKQKSDLEMALLASLPWRCTNFGNSSEIEACVEQTGRWETLAETHSVGDVVDAEDIGSFIVKSVNQYQEMKSALKQARMALKACAGCEGVEEKAKSKAKSALKKIENTLL